VIVAPIVTSVAWQVIRTRAAGTRRATLAAMLPVLGWYGFAGVYYGSPLPNTAYAKVVMPWSQGFLMGWHYLVDYARYEPLQAVLIVAAVAGGMVVSVRERLARRSEASVPGVLAFGVLLHLVYVASIGGDYMKGRFVDTPLAASAGLGVVLLGHCLPRRPLAREGRLAIGLIALVCLLVQVRSPLALTCMHRGIEWLQFSLSRGAAAGVLFGYLLALGGLIHLAQRRAGNRGQWVFGLIMLAWTATLLGLIGYRPMTWPVLVVFVATGLWAAFWIATSSSAVIRPASPANFAACLLIAGAASLCDIDRRSESGSGAISDDFSFYHIRGWYNPFHHPIERLRGSAARWRRIGLASARYADRCGPITVAYESLGIISYYSGPRVRVIDLCGLADPFLNRGRTPPCGRPGHVPFEIPAGYLETRGAINLLPDWFARLEGLDPGLGPAAARLPDSARWSDPDDRARWQATCRIITGPLWSLDRWRAIPRFVRPRREYLPDEAECRRVRETLAPFIP
jgi:hypothetical protein